MADVLSIEDIESADFAVGDKKSETERIPFLPAKNQTWPFDIRILVNPISSELGRPYHESHVHSLQMGNKWVNVPCPRTLGKHCYMCDARWNAVDKMKTLEERGQKDTAEWKQAYITSELYKQKKQFMFLAAKRNDPVIYIFYSGPALVKAIFGDKAKGVSGALHAVREFGVSIFSAPQPTGWITVNKTGKKLDTVYSADATMRSVIEGKTKRVELLEENLHEGIIEKFKNVESLPRVLETYKGRMWTEEEMQAYVDSNGTTIPQKIAQWVGAGAKPEGEKPSQKVESASFDTTVEDFDPF